MYKVYTSAVVIIPPKEIWGPIQEIRKRYDHQINRWMPHITLIYPFRPESEFDNLETEFKAVCMQIHPFKIILKLFNHFTHGHHNLTIWLQPEPKINIVDLQNRIQKIVPNCNDVQLYKNGFIPHLSLGQIKDKNLLMDTIKILENKWEKQTFILDRIYFIARKQGKNSSFKEKTIIKLSS
ncbi:MAG: 2'-5' RNA ligase family protein [Promethearchaeota archaeon]